MPDAPPWCTSLIQGESGFYSMQCVVSELVPMDITAIGTRVIQ